MFRNYLRTAWRNLRKNAFYSALNVSGLTVGLATGIMLLMWVRNEFSYDKFHKNYRNIFQLSTHFNANGGEVTWPWAPGPVAVLAKNVPDVVRIVRIENDNDAVLSDGAKDKIIGGNRVAAVDSGFFKMFSFPFLSRESVAPFPNTNSIILTKSAAKKFFGNADALGKIILYSKNSFTVSGIIRDFPENSSLRYDALLPMSFYAQEFTSWGGNGNWKTIDEDLGDFSFATFVQLVANADPVKTGSVFSDLYKKARNGDSNAKFTLENLGDIHLIGPDGNRSDLRMVEIFLVVVVLLLLIAGINYVNLSTARALTRVKEVGIRKIVGANKLQLFFQFITETILLFCFATVAAIGLIYLLMPLYNDLSGKNFTFNIADTGVWEVTSAAVFGTLIASSIYPAFLLSSFRPVASLKGKLKQGIGVGSLRKSLVIFQFVISIVLLICTVIIADQMQFIRHKNLGYDKSYVFTVPLSDEAKGHLDAIKNEIRKSPSVIDVATSDAQSITDVNASTGDLDWEGKSPDNNMIITQVYADKDLIPTMKIQMAEGANFTGTPADSAYVILNQTAIKKMGLDEPVVGRQISFHNRKEIIRGVVKDFNFKSLKEAISPLIFYNFWPNGSILYIRTSGADAQRAISETKQVFDKYSGDTPFSYHFLDQDFAEQYRADERSGTLFNLFAGIAIFISCLGLFGLSTYTAQVKIKEIGIRKVLGAGVTAIVTLISKDFLKLVLAGIIIATPIAWWATHKWLEGFAYRISISFWVFIFAGMAAILIAFFTVGFQAIKAAMANPVESLRTE
jgi:putative ABC transport system permease protein